SSASSGHPKALKIVAATLFSCLVQIRCLLWRLFSSICTLLASIAHFGLLSGCCFQIGWHCLFCPDAPLVDRLGIIDAMVKYSGQDTVEALGDLMEILEGQLAFVQLAIDEDVVDDLLHHPLN